MYTQPIQNPWRSINPKQHERKGLGRLSKILGGGLLLCLILQYSIGVLCGFAANFFPSLQTEEWNLFSMFASTVLAFLPAALYCLKRLSPVEHNDAMPFGLPCKAQQGARLATTVGCVFAGVLVNAVAGNLVGGLELGAEFFGLKLLPDEALDFSGGRLWMNLIVVVAAPAVAEEVLMRGVVMQTLRRFGDMFAIAASALLFGLMHQNLVQIPFAFCVGLALGYAVVRTGSLWTGILLHLWVNGASVLLQHFAVGGDEVRLMLLHNAINLIVGIIGLVLLIVNRKYFVPMRGSKFAANTSTRLRYLFFGHVVMIIALALYLFNTVAVTIMANWRG
ncbi:MAG: CPBP family intramembrane metalloprotease [Oscillospiraceae bacterium]|jgi:membrane protease YdiL (CAAX protease family)|nr:CPBP family intramembrane metalloprotease [Oscillospiraceae bacterium]